MDETGVKKFFNSHNRQKSGGMLTRSLSMIPLHKTLTLYPSGFKLQAFFSFLFYLSYLQALSFKLQAFFSFLFYLSY
ncbi:MAG: hypothetical protein JXD22_04325, partial [Sedimentisphaerales bacterium]|nr:hypothetical protein [Sedimentisphaerales bacterium]